MKKGFRDTTPPHRRQMSVLSSKSNKSNSKASNSSMISSIAMKKQIEKNKQVKENKRLAAAKRYGSCTRKAQPPSPICLKLNQTGREGQKVLDHLELTTGLTNKYL